MFAKKDVLPMFPKPVVKGSMDRPFTEEEKNYMLSQSMDPGISNSSSRNRRVLDVPEMVNLKKIAQDSLNFWVNEIMMIQTGLELQLTQSWMNTTKPGQVHHNHYHPNSIVSGVIYINAIDDKDRIMLLDPTPVPYKFTVKEHNLFNSEEYHLSVKTGDIVLFPSLMFHGVPPVTANHDRVSLAFNSFWKGTLGFANDSTNYLEINDIK